MNANSRDRGEWKAGVGADSDRVAAVIAMLEDDHANAEIIRYAAETHGVSRLVVKRASAAHNGRFAIDGAMVVHPTTGLVALLS